MVFVQFLIEKNSLQDIETATASKKEKLQKIVFWDEIWLLFTFKLVPHITK